MASPDVRADPARIHIPVRAACRVRDTVPAYRRHLEAAGLDDISAETWAHVPFTDKATVFGADPAQWAVGGRLANAAEVVCSSGQSGPAVSVGLTSRADQDAMRDRVDAMLASLGAGPDSSSLLVNVLPMGISVPTSIATAATPSVHLEMALHVLSDIAPQFDRVVLVGEPPFLTELSRRWADTGAVHPDLWVVTGGEPVAESWRTYCCSVLGVEPFRVMVSMGVAEVGVHVLSETPQLAHTHRAISAGDPALRPWWNLIRRTDVPRLFTYDPSLLYFETRTHPDGPPTIAVTTLAERDLPLVRYDLGDIGVVLDAAAVAALEAQAGIGLPPDIVAVFGRSAHVTGPAGRVYPEQVREWLFALPALAAEATGRFRLLVDGDRLDCHVQVRGSVPGGLSADADTLADRLGDAFGAPAAVRLHGAADYPFHQAGDWTHKARYVGALDA